MPVDFHLVSLFQVTVFKSVFEGTDEVSGPQTGRENPMSRTWMMKGAELRPLFSEGSFASAGRRMKSFVAHETASANKAVAKRQPAASGPPASPLREPPVCASARQMSQAPLIQLQCLLKCLPLRDVPTRPRVATAGEQNKCTRAENTDLVFMFAET